MKSVYTSGLISQSFWFNEFKKLNELKNMGKTTDEIRKICIDENYIGAHNEYRSKRITGYLIKRIALMSDELIEIFINADIKTQKIINLITILHSDRLFFEFVYEVYREKLILGIQEITISDATSFFIKKETQVNELTQWKDITVKKLGNIYINFLTESGLVCVNQNTNKRIVERPILDYSLKIYLQNNNESALLKAISGERQ